ncbi:hypothetical protein GCM10007962_24770 [Yeosuana aromativorans]|uniref:Seryl-tRNA synthetase n=2 Tax=Yeosuana aromativorans TaxID=288019 RepID=A0A8J3BPT7_9FLAO|nr:hypothetical protein GCM10007962_24770 [Yeosuana aromativorans]
MVSLGTFSLANASESAATPITNEIPAEITVMLNRLEEIKDMDKSSLTRSEKKDLRIEVREIKKEVRSSGNGLYISAGAIIVILLILLII